MEADAVSQSAFEAFMDAHDEALESSMMAVKIPVLRDGALRANERAPAASG